MKLSAVATTMAALAASAAAGPVAGVSRWLVGKGETRPPIERVRFNPNTRMPTDPTGGALLLLLRRGTQESRQLQPHAGVPLR